MFLWVMLLLAAPVTSHQNPHAGLACAGCHAESSGHIASIEKTCGHCHAKEARLFSASQHRTTGEAGPTCITCHGSHDLKTAEQIERQCMECHRAPPMFFMNPVPRVAGKVSCMNCHSAHSD